MTGFTRSREGKFWLALEGFHMWQMYRNNIGVQNIMTMIDQENRSSIKLNEKWKFMELGGASKYLKEITRKQIQEADKQLSFADPVFRTINYIEPSYLTDNSSEENPHSEVNHLIVPSTDASHNESVIEHTEVNLWTTLSGELNEILGNFRFEYDIGIFTAAIVALIIPPIVIWYIWNGRMKAVMIAKFVERQSAQSQLISSERQKSESLLANMLPERVGRVLRAGGAVKPETYPEATLLFTDIEDFAAIAAQASPFQIIELLNNVFNKWDGMLGSFDCYKVESIGDAYVVASGLPIRNGQKHSNGTQPCKH